MTTSMLRSTLGCTSSQHDIQQIFAVQPSRHVPRACVRRTPAPPYLKDEDRQILDMEERERGGGSGRREHGGPGSYVPPDPFDSPDLDAPTFSLGLIPFAPKHPSGTGTSYVPPDPFDSPDTDYV
ncbi:hypothetical protein M9H77_02479 [Catharanthus roseus]|uniref:Uncharacterized protein n=1 Tax=Catharanthus roseus TaxID=4058 RepID=A0ACC0C8T6_CATRO|nr:hypothetical protein M9H77_02479 [Catharanthus roseus]